ncbi:competence/damage-inducible protein A [Flavicella sp.]|uniref:competence/damage-inducible protein A n=1 Tax=Flavicella sp. TaxID=2957742 RepID=UPI0026345A8A|nr:competence/damage-inducible protein A [Flavicella sp.]MDG1803399.1 competence/damage-inducible protein A [Flavicella sp.]
MKVEIITIGDEILIGQIVDTNSQWMATELNKIGVSVYQVTSIQDDEAHILQAFRDAQSRVDVVLVTGGLGPTKDDITKHTFAKYFSDELILNDSVVKHVKSMFSKRNIPFSELNRLQGLVPSKCTVLHNELGTAPGMLFDENDTVFVSMPGVPFEMKGLMTGQVLPFLRNKFTLPFIQHKTIITYGIGESALAEKLETWEEEFPAILSLAYLPSPGKVKLRLSGKYFDKQALEETIAAEVSKLQHQLGELIVGYEDDESIVELIASLLKKNNKTLAVAESCTGGYLTSMLTEKSGASAFFVASLVAYTQKVKINELGVLPSTIEKYSVVSTQVAEEMASGMLKKSEANFAIATTGNAGPTTDETDKTVGVVCIAIASDSGVYSEEFNFGKPREKVIHRSSNKALEILRKEILKNY